jgi:predicted MFS family arabinose efflux permease
MFVPLLYHTIGLAFWQLLTLVFIGGLLRSPADTARLALVPDLAKLAHMRLERANAWNDGSRRGANFFGAPLAGVLIALIGTSNLLWLDAASFGISTLLIGLSLPKIAQHRAETAQAKPARGYLAELKEGLRFIKLDVVILTLMLVIMITNMIDSAYSAVVAPAYIMQAFHSALPLGLMIAVFGGMAFIGTVIFGTIGHHLPRRLTFGIGFIIGGALRFWFLLTANFPLILAWFALAGLAIGPINSLISTTLQERTPPAMRARVFGLLEAGVMAGIPLGTFAIGFVAVWIGLRWTLALMGTLYLLATLSILVNPALKKMNREAAGED